MSAARRVNLWKLMTYQQLSRKDHGRPLVRNPTGRGPSQNLTVF